MVAMDKNLYNELLTKFFNKLKKVGKRPPYPPEYYLVKIGKDKTTRWAIIDGANPIAVEQYEWKAWRADYGDTTETRGRKWGFRVYWEGKPFGEDRDQEVAEFQKAKKIHEAFINQTEYPIEAMKAEEGVFDHLEQEQDSVPENSDPFLEPPIDGWPF